jgi:hypothetical protein
VRPRAAAAGGGCQSTRPGVRVRCLPNSEDVAELAVVFADVPQRVWNALLLPGHIDRIAPLKLAVSEDIWDDIWMVALAVDFRYWAVACFQCLVGFALGRLVEIDDAGLPVAPHFGGFREVEADAWVGDADLRRGIELFLIEHLGHELGLVETDQITEALEGFDIGEEPFHILDQRSEVIGTYHADTIDIATKRLERIIAANRGNVNLFGSHEEIERRYLES